MTLVAKSSALFLLGCILVCSTESTATAQNARQIFNKCVEHIDQLNDRVTNAQRQTVRECVPRIKRLLNVGEYEEARRVARRCIHRLDNLTDAGLQALRETCRRCIRALRELEAYQLAERLSVLCEETAQHLNQQNERAKNIIRDLF